MPFDGATLPPIAKTLVDARGFLERGWCRGTEARTVHGNKVSPCHPDAVSWCLYGAIAAVNTPFIGSSMNIVERVLQSLNDPHTIRLPADFPKITVFNDRQVSVEPVLAVVDQAIALAITENK
jgi:hypothetical protein